MCDHRKLDRGWGIAQTNDRSKQKAGAQATKLSENYPNRANILCVYRLILFPSLPLHQHFQAPMVE